MLGTRTFLFADLRDYTRFVERHGDEAARTLIEDYRRIVRTEVGRHDGAEIKTEGDSFYVVFTNSRAAVAAGTAVLREAERYSRERPDRPMRVGIGVHAGEPVPHEGQFVGSSVILAARLAQSAEAGELLVSDVVRGLLPKSMAGSLDERHGLALKGIDDPPRVFRVAWEPLATPRGATRAAVSIETDAPESHQILCPIVVGRERESAALDALLAEAIAGQGRTGLVSGDAGLGKSALLRGFRERAVAAGARVLVGECTEIEARRPFGPFIDALAGAGVPLPAELAQGAPGAQPDAESERYRVHQGFVERLAQAAQERPVVVVVEDLHWADEATFELVPYLARKLRDKRVLLLATYRSDELHRLHPLNHVLAELARARLATEVRLHKLTLEETGDVLRAAMRLRRPPSAELRQALWERTEGNPFFIEEILRALLERGDLEWREGSWRRTKGVAELAIPVSVRDAVQQRLLAMEPSARRVMQVAAVIGQRFDFELLREISGLDETAVLDAIKSAIDAQLVREETDGDEETYAFRHALSREAVLAEMLQRERRLLHRAVGEAIERRAGGGLAARAEDLAYHFDQARDTARAFRYHEIAAGEAERVFAFSRGLGHLERAVELAPDDEPRLGELYLRLWDLSGSVGDLPRARAAAEQAIALAQASANADLRATATARLSRTLWLSGETGRARALTESAIAELGTKPPSAGLAALHGELARLAYLGRDDDVASREGRRAIDMAKEVGAVDVEADASQSVGAVMARQGDRAGLELIRRSIALADARGFIRVSQRGYTNLAATTEELGAEAADLRRIHVEALANARRRGYHDQVALASEVRQLFGDGRWDEALAAYDELDESAIFTSVATEAVATIRMARDGPGEATFALVEEARHRFVAAGDPQWRAAAALSAIPYHLAGRYPEMLERMAPSAEDLITFARRGIAQTPVVYALDAADRVGDAAALALWADVAERRATSAPERPAPDAAFARALAIQRGGGDALAGYEQAAADAERVRFGERSAFLARWRVADVLAARGDLASARDAFDRATSLWRAGGATWYLARLEEWARAHGIPKPA